ncbi:MAG: UDP-N-acetylmuramoyl-tripeptide--D-alanyl-D-alanine ligase [Prolixibacteraceae bacterium]|nr:UDP-N-acetylmuramoyl-tripeptide--D-alanyl-D-alanine ligase [Prolixibacteraceae bacterium]
MKIEELYSIFVKHPEVSTDSRKISEGCLFFAIKGENFNGNLFANKAIEKGASYAIVDEARDIDERIIIVDDVLKCLQDIACYHRHQLKTKILAITGTNGKTTTKELIYAVLSQKYNITCTFKNLNNHIGVPLSLLRLTTKTQIGIIEMGASHPGEIADLCKIVDPDLGLITNVGKAHLAGFKSLEGVIKTKAALYDFLRQKGGKCFINIDNPLLLKQASDLDQITYGKSEKAQLTGIPVKGKYFLTVNILFPKGRLDIHSNLIGFYNFENILAAARVGIYFGVDPLDIAKAVKNYKPDNNRSQLIKIRSNKIVMDAYNANPTSMKASIENFSDIDHPHKSIILGDMMELGEQSEKEHQKIVDFVQTKDFADIYLVGSFFAKTNTKTNTDKKIRKFSSSDLLSEYLKKAEHAEEKLILIKGSRGIKLEKILKFI